MDWMVQNQESAEIIYLSEAFVIPESAVRRLSGIFWRLGEPKIPAPASARPG